MPTYYTPPTDRLGMTGEFLASVDDGSYTTISNPPATSIVHRRGFNPAYPNLVDASAVLHQRALGLAMGDLRVSGPVQIDRLLTQIFTAGFGPRSTNLADPALSPWVATVLPAAGDTAFSFGKIWWSSMRLSGARGYSGGSSIVHYELQGMVFDPNNAAGIFALATPSSSGTSGVNLSSANNMSITNGASSGTVTYDDWTSFDLTFANQLVPIKAADPVLGSSAVGAGAAPGVIRGQLKLAQFRYAANAFPSSNGVYGIDLVIPDPAGDHTLTVKLSVSYDSDSQSFQPDDINQIGYTYEIFGSANSLTWPVTATYA